jgi:hypothetical protein
MALRRTAETGKVWAAWAGDKDRLLRLCTVVAELAGQAREEEMRPLVATHEAEVAEVLSKLPAGSVPPLGLTDRHERERQEVETRWEPRAEAAEGIERYDGTSKLVVDAMDPPAVTEFHLRVPPNVYVSAPRVVLRMRASKGVNYEIEGPPTWVAAGAAKLEEEITRGVPWWWRLRDLRDGTLIFGGISGVAAMIGALGIDDTPWPFVVLLGMSIGGLAGLILQSVAEKLLPGLEILAVGGRARGSRVVAFVAVVAFEVALAVVPNLLS